MQVCRHVQAVARRCDIRAVPIVGGISHLKQERYLNYRPEIVVATPGRLWELMSSGSYPFLADMSRLRYVVVDEADRMGEKGHYQELLYILERLSPLW